jgi:hypothetical protein
MQEDTGASPVLSAIGGMFVISLLDAMGVLPSESLLGLAVFYGLFGACGGLVAYALVKRLRK